MDHTLQTTALINEAYLRLAARTALMTWRGVRYIREYIHADYGAHPRSVVEVG